MQDRFDAEIVNIVARGALTDGNLDVAALVADLDVEDSAVLPGRAYLWHHIGDPAVMIFRRGSFAIAGATSETQIMSKAKWLVGELQQLGMSISEDTVLDSIDIKYAVVNGNLNNRVDLSRASIALGLEHTEYEPEQFPAVIYRSPDFNSTVLLFSSGRVSVTGVKDKETAIKIMENLEDTLRESGYLSNK